MIIKLYCFIVIFCKTIPQTKSGLWKTVKISWSYHIIDTPSRLCYLLRCNQTKQRIIWELTVLRSRETDIWRKIRRGGSPKNRCCLSSIETHRVCWTFMTGIAKSIIRESVNKATRWIFMKRAGKKAEKLSTFLVVCKNAHIMKTEMLHKKWNNFNFNHLILYPVQLSYL